MASIPTPVPKSRPTSAPRRLGMPIDERSKIDKEERERFLRAVAFGLEEVAKILPNWPGGPESVATTIASDEEAVAWIVVEDLSASRIILVHVEHDEDEDALKAHSMTVTLERVRALKRAVDRLVGDIDAKLREDGRKPT